MNEKVSRKGAKKGSSFARFALSLRLSRETFLLTSAV
jgi:hypothetical protein